MQKIMEEGVDMDDPFETWFSILRMVEQLKTLFGQFEDGDTDNEDKNEDDSDDSESSDESEEEVFPWIASRYQR